MPDRHSVIREGIIAGVIGATAVAVWFLIVDLVAREPFFTPELLGRTFFSLFGPIPTEEAATVHIIGYTIVHFAAFIALGMLAVALAHWAEREPAILAGFLILFVAIQLGFYGFVALLAEQDVLGSLAWYQIGAANLLAAVLMGLYLWKAHPRLSLRYGLEGGERAAR